MGRDRAETDRGGDRGTETERERSRDRAETEIEGLTDVETEKTSESTSLDKTSQWPPIYIDGQRFITGQHERHSQSKTKRCEAVQSSDL